MEGCRVTVGMVACQKRGGRGVVVAVAVAWLNGIGEGRRDEYHGDDCNDEDDEDGDCGGMAAVMEVCIRSRRWISFGW